MTERIYYASDATEGCAHIISCSAEADGGYAIELDRTLFHPQGGGQPSDRGWIDEQPVMAVTTRGDSVLHIVAQPLPLGEVELRIDAPVRQRHARLHSAGHLLGLAGEQFGWRPVKAHHWPGEGRITFAAGAGAALPEASALLAQVSAWQKQDLPRRITFANGLRAVGFGELAAYPCGGTHVVSLAALGNIVISQLKMKKGQMIVSYTLE
ncbi:MULTISPECIES: alanyl-tRNA synthetase [Klebsiella]|jgi:Predicted metal-dependent hydrolases related to alanyl-tRNA synthetase HxxxH domain|uniref:alanyl-tRNA synthetase n=1 Tax=Klebsiella TaxID=570 RepID=UPI00063CBF07|nr:MULTISPECIES: alanyl-tRNA synthetase [Klebsiella]EIW9479776.1 alanyl-tRNA editing protein [Klebsiella aerogenes]EIW9499980.1 alanyl-tRNA editing protein [Klebsiella aerogenes]EKM7515329.1 alanyl-tRNA editing protein [Klebsiella aerogenes]EKU6610679.1 alanyl-tRNA editing protein [Klebsiella aerogenes]EKW5858531.1 alanyl-tRNA editing protein [Klebsiella aerogenes]